MRAYSVKHAFSVKFGFSVNSPLPGMRGLSVSRAPTGWILGQAWIVGQSPDGGSTRSIFTLDIGLAPEGLGTRVTWVRRFETAGVRDALLPHMGDKNEESLDRLVEVVG